MKFTTEWFEVHRESWDRWLRPWLLEREPVRVLEVGSFEGRSACWFLGVLGHPESTVNCIDSWASPDYDAAYKRFVANVEQAAVEAGATWMRYDSLHAMSGLSDGQFDCVYIDGDHSVSGVRDDTVEALRLVKPDGVIIWDDYFSNTSGKLGVKRGDAWVPTEQDTVRAGVAEALGDDLGLVERVDAAAVLWMDSSRRARPHRRERSGSG